jgi:hypothetical protein
MLQAIEGEQRSMIALSGIGIGVDLSPSLLARDALNISLARSVRVSLHYPSPDWSY